jgi:UDP-N-acetylmuramate--alanine ligase
VAVVGTCGKSTVTAMLGHILAECGMDPLCVNGANVPGWEGAVRFGNGVYAVAEVDESDKSLVAFKPYAAVVTNASADHYSKEEMDEVFDAFVKDAPGPVVDARGETYRPQDYNLQNASLAVRMAVRLGCGEDAAKRAIESFGGVERRLQLIGNSAGASGAFVYDDYAHNPEKIRSMWLTLAERHPQGICVIWRPHGYGPLRKLLNPLAEMFNETIRPQDKLLLLPVYDAGGTACRDLNSSALAAKIDRNKVELADGLQAAYQWCTIHYTQFAAFVTCGARDPALPALAKDLHEL